MKLIGMFTLLLFTLSVSCSGRARTGGQDGGATTAIHWSQAALDAAGIKPGDVVLIKSGTYRDAVVKLHLEATADFPIVIRAEKQGEVILTGNSSISISGSNVTVAGFHFKDCDVAAGGALFNFRTSPREHAYNCRLYNCVFSGSGLAFNKEKDIKWVSVYGSDNQVDRCSFIDKKILGSLLVVWVDPAVVSRHRINDNFFTHPFSLTESGAALNGQEMIRIGTSAVSMSEAKCEVYGNYFYKCNGEVEIISNKSCGNTYSGNLFEQCKGTLTLRHGNGCTVEGNFFLGRGIENTGGVRIIGEDHRVFNNYFEALGGSDQRAAISLIRGVENSELHEYFQVKGAGVAFNTIVNCNNGIVANTGRSAATMPVISTAIAANVIVCDKNASDKGVVNTTSPTPQIDWHDNHLFGVTLTGIGFGDGFSNMEAFPLVKETGIYKITSQAAEALNKVGEFDYITRDISGNPRRGGKTPGAFEPGDAAPTMPSKTTAGAKWAPKL